MKSIVIIVIMLIGSLSSYSQAQTKKKIMNDLSVTDSNKKAVRLLLEDAMPNGHFDLIRDIVSKDCITQRAGFANLFLATGDAIPEKGNFLDWLESGWKPLSEALSNQHVDIYEVVGEGNLVMIRYHMKAIHSGTFVGVPATGKTVEWDEVATAQFGEGGKIERLWFMCEELKMAFQLGLNLKNTLE